MRYRGTRRDANHKAIVAELKLIGCSIIDLAAVGAGCPDILAGFRGRNYLLEIKNPKHRRKSGSTNPTTGDKQAAFREAWKGNASVVETVEEAFRAVGYVVSL